MEKKKVSSQLEEINRGRYKKSYDDLFEHAMHLLNDHQKPLELVAGTMMAIAQRLYKTQLDDEEYHELMEVMRDAPVKPYDVKKVRLN
jgi:tRNA C32,U32 (ribose-2'-O)-methylase TrmJ